MELFQHWFYEADGEDGIEEANVILFVVDVTTGITHLDSEVAKMRERGDAVRDADMAVSERVLDRPAAHVGGIGDLDHDGVPGRRCE